MIEEVKTKTCSECKEEKEEKLFSIGNKNQPGNKCRICKNKEARINWAIRQDKKKNPQNYPPKPEDSNRKVCGRCRIEKDFSEYGYCRKSKYKIKSACKKCRAEEFQNRKPQVYEYVRNKMKNDPKYRIKRRLRWLLWYYLGRAKVKKSDKTVNILGCSLNQLKSHIESLFEPNMSWAGLMSGKIHLDHVVPCAAFDLSKPDEVKKCFNYKNLSPRWATTDIAKENGSNQIGNLNKGAKILSEEQVLAEQGSLDFNLPLI